MTQTNIRNNFFIMRVLKHLHKWPERWQIPHPWKQIAQGSELSDLDEDDPARCRLGGLDDL